MTLRITRWPGRGLLAVSLVATACALIGATAASAKPTGSPIKIGQFIAENSPVNNVPQAKSAVMARIDAMNKKNGLAGHPLKLITCNDRNDTNESAKCARMFIDEKVAFVAGSNLLLNQVAAPLLTNAGIAVVGHNPTGADYNANNLMLFGPGSLNLYGMIASYLLSKKSPSVIVAADGANGRATVNLVGKQTESNGLGKLDAIFVSPTTADWAPTVARVKATGAKNVVFLVSTNNIAQYIAAANRAGVSTNYWGLQFVPPADAASIGGTKVNDKFTLISSMPSPYAKNKVMAQFRKEMTARAKKGDKLAALKSADLVSIQTWLGLYAVEKMVAQMKVKTINNQTILNGMNSVKRIDLGGIVPGGWTPSKTKVAVGFSRINETYAYMLGFKNGKSYNKLSKPFNLKQALAGKFPK